MFREIPLIVLSFLYSSTLLRFFVRRIFGDELWRRSGAGGVVVLWLEKLLVVCALDILQPEFSLS